MLMPQECSSMGHIFLFGFPVDYTFIHNFLKPDGLFLEYNWLIVLLSFIF